MQRIMRPIGFAGFVLGAIFWAGIAAGQSTISGQNLASSSMNMFDFESARDSFFNKADRDGDLSLSPDEISEALGPTPSLLFGATDYNGDGQITYGEYTQSTSEIFDFLDRNGDKVLTQDEF